MDRERCGGDTPLDFLRRNRWERPQALALAGGERSWTWAEIWDAGQRAATEMVRGGVRAGDRVAYVTADNAEGLVLLIGIWLAGAVASPINRSLPTGLVERTLDRLRPCWVVLGGCETYVPPPQYPRLRVQGTAAAEPSLLPPPPVPDAPALILFTSGSTGLPKGVLSTHRAVALNARRTAQALSLGPDERILINTPHYYTSAILHFLTLACRGGGLVGWTGFLFSATFCEAVERFGCTGFGGAPAHFVRILEALPERRPRLRFLMSSGDHLPDHLALKARQAFPGARVYRVYGLSEVAGRLCVLDPDLLEVKPGSVGRPLPGMTVSIRREDGITEAAPGELGEVYVRGDMLTQGYFEDEAAGRELRTPAGFRTGDCGLLDADGFLFLRGRRDDVFKSGGEKVSCLLIQQELQNLGLFRDVAVLPVRDELLGRIPKVYYVPAGETPVEPFAVIRALRGRLPQSHLPARFEEVETIPRTGSGKIVRAELLAAGPRV